MRKKIEYMFYAIVALVALLALSLCYNYKQYMDGLNVSEKIRVEVKEAVVEKVVHDTIPVLQTEYVIGTAHIPVHTPSEQHPHPSLNDSSVVELPIVQKVYENDTLYTAYVSGVKYDDFPRLDSIDVRQRTVYQTVTITKEKWKKQKKFGIGVIGGYGYGFNSRKVEPYIGLGVSWHLFEF